MSGQQGWKKWQTTVSFLHCDADLTDAHQKELASKELSNVIEATLSFLIILFLVAFIMGLVLGVSLTRPSIR